MVTNKPESLQACIQQVKDKVPSRQREFNQLSVSVCWRWTLLSAYEVTSSPAWRNFSQGESRSIIITNPPWQWPWDCRYQFRVFWNNVSKKKKTKKTWRFLEFLMVVFTSTWKQQTVCKTMLFSSFWHDTIMLSNVVSKSVMKLLEVLDKALWSPGLDRIFIRLAPALPTLLSLSSLSACTCVGTPLRWEPMWQQPINITNIQVNITFISPKLIDEVPSHTNGA